MAKTKQGQSFTSSQLGANHQAIIVWRATRAAGGETKGFSFDFFKRVRLHSIRATPGKTKTWVVSDISIHFETMIQSTETLMIMMPMPASVTSAHIRTGGVLQAQQCVRASSITRLLSPMFCLHWTKAALLKEGVPLIWYWEFRIAGVEGVEEDQ